MNTTKSLPHSRRWGYRLLLLLLLLALGPLTYAATPRIKEAKWEDGDARLVVKVVRAGRNAVVTITSVETGDVLAQPRANKEGKLEAKISIPSDVPVPCSVQASTNSVSAARGVEEAPRNCGQVTVEQEEEEEQTGGSGGSGGGGISEHQKLTTYEGTRTCLKCHTTHAIDLFGSTHYQWKGIGLDMLNQTDGVQGKHAGAVNTYCGNILGNWTGCSACHIGLGAQPGEFPTVEQLENGEVPTVEQLENIDCLICHQEGYKRKTTSVNGKVVRVPDWDNMTMSERELVQTVHKPTRVTCLQCHAKAGGGDAVKRGDLALATGSTTDKAYDVHMATTGANLSCQDCHVPENHRFPGKGSDIRPTDLDVILECASSGCHGSSPHDSSDINRHTARVACQVCHIPVYGKDASDSIADEATEIHRSWLAGSDHMAPPYHPVLTKENDLIPVYRHWNGRSDNYLLGDRVPVDFVGEPIQPVHTSVPDGAVDDAGSKLYPFKYKTSDYPMRTVSKELVALDTSKFFANADPSEAARWGLENMGFDGGNLDDLADATRPGDKITWVTTDTYQLLNHQVSPHDDALSCSQCHMSTAQMDLQGELGYAPTNPSKSTCSAGCHDAKKAREWSYGSVSEYKEGHKKHREKGVACNKCHGFSR